MILIGTSLDDILEGTLRRDFLTGGAGADIFRLKRDGKVDKVFDFDDGIDIIDLSHYNITWDEVMIKHLEDSEFAIIIRGEKNLITVQPPETWEPAPSIHTFTADDFIFNTGAAVPDINIVLDGDGAGRITGTGLIDHFVMLQDGNRDVVLDYEPGKDKVDLAIFGTTFNQLSFVDRQPGKIVVRLGTETVVIRDVSRELTSAELSADDFIF